MEKVALFLNSLPDATEGIGELTIQTLCGHCWTLKFAQGRPVIAPPVVYQQKFVWYTVLHQDPSSTEPVALHSYDNVTKSTSKAVVGLLFKDPYLRRATEQGLCAEAGTTSVTSSSCYQLTFQTLDKRVHQLIRAHMIAWAKRVAPPSLLERATSLPCIATVCLVWVMIPIATITLEAMHIKEPNTRILSGEKAIYFFVSLLLIGQITLKALSMDSSSRRV